MNVTLLICLVIILFSMPQELPEHFEENMDKWMKNFLILLTINSKDLKLEVNNVFSMAVGYKI